MADITFGRYISRKTFVHRLDPRSKLLMLILLMVTIFLHFNVWSTALIMSGVYLVLLILLMVMSKVRFGDLFRSMKSMWFLIVFLLLIYILIPNSAYTHPAFRIWKLTIYYDAFYQAAYIILRLILMISLTMVLTATTKPMDLTYAFEWYMTPLTLIRFPSHIIAMTLSIALRFIPTLLDETNRIMKAQSSRGVDFEHGGFGKKLRAVISLIVPLIFSAIERSEELSNAMEVRGYDPSAKRTRYRSLRFSFRDLAALLVVLLLFGGVLTLVILDTAEHPINLIEIFFGVNPGF